MSRECVHTHTHARVHVHTHTHTWTHTCRSLCVESRSATTRGRLGRPSHSGGLLLLGSTSTPGGRETYEVRSLVPGVWVCGPSFLKGVTFDSRFHKRRNPSRVDFGSDGPVRDRQEKSVRKRVELSQDQGWGTRHRDLPRSGTVGGVVPPGRPPVHRFVPETVGGPVTGSGRSGGPLSHCVSSDGGRCTPSPTVDRIKCTASEAGVVGPPGRSQRDTRPPPP